MMRHNLWLFPKKNKGHYSWGSLGIKKGKGSSIMVFMIEHSCPHSADSHSLLTCQMSTSVSDAPFLQTMTVCVSAGYQAEWFVKPRCHIDSFIPDLTGVLVYSCCSTCTLNGIHEFLSTTLNGCEGPHWDHIRNRWFAWQGSRDREKCSQRNMGRTSNIDVSISQAKQRENEYMMQACSCQ